MNSTAIHEWLLNVIAEPRTIQKLREFRRLPDGWHYGSGGPISEITFENAKRVHECLFENGFTYTDAFPGAEGEVQLTAYQGAHFISIIIEPEGQMSFAHEENDIDVSEPEENISLSSVKQRITDASRAIWNSSDSCIHGTLTKTRTASPSWDLRSLLPMTAPQSLS